MIIYIIIVSLVYNYQSSLQKKDSTIYFQLFYDELTGLPSRKKLMKDIENSRNKTLILFNIDDFKRVNSLIGVRGGDIVLKETADRLKNYSQINPLFKVYKLSADEFAFLLPRIEQSEHISELVEQINTTIRNDIIINNSSLIITATMGISSIHGKLLITSDIALKMAKRQKRSYIVYDHTLKIPQLNKENLNHLYNLQKAIEGDNIVPFFQPIYCNTNKSIYKYECLIRQKSSDRIIGPSVFLELSRKAKIYPSLTRIMISKSFKYFVKKEIPFSINLSLEDIMDRETTQHIYTELKKFNIGRLVTFELLESEQIERYSEVIDFLDNIRKLNCSIAIDDFGTGYSNFDLLLKIKFDYIKLDGTIIKNIIHDEKARILIKSLIAFSQQMGAKTIAEYVMNKEIFDMVNHYGIDYSQGYYIGMPREEIMTDEKKVINN
ncbi:MAG: EAL domain-containing protein [Spirochaetales bacterium]|nr:EAL domain-containing protein [Spirochaetales bacterium]